MRLYKIIMICCFIGAVSVASAFGATAEQEKNAFIASDKNKDDQLNYAEFKRFISKMAKLGNKKAAEAESLGFVSLKIGFNRGDKNGDGQLTPDELRSLK